MAWQDVSTEILRNLLGDTETVQTYTDAKLIRVLMVASFQTVLEVDFLQTYSIAIVAQTITPDPTNPTTQDDSFVNLVTMKAACIIDHSSAVLAAARAISVRDNGAAVDLRGVFGANLQLLEKGWCAVYDDTKYKFQADRRGIAGAAIMTPFRLYSLGDPYGWGQDGYLGPQRGTNTIY